MYICIYMYIYVYMYICAKTFEPFNSSAAVRRTSIDSPCNKQVKQRYIY